MQIKLYFLSLDFTEGNRFTVFILVRKLQGLLILGVGCGYLLSHEVFAVVLDHNKVFVCVNFIYYWVSDDGYFLIERWIYFFTHWGSLCLLFIFFRLIGFLLLLIFFRDVALCLQGFDWCILEFLDQNLDLALKLFLDQITELRLRCLRCSQYRLWYFLLQLLLTFACRRNIRNRRVLFKPTRLFWDVV